MRQTLYYSTRGSLLIGAVVVVAIFAIFMGGVLIYVSNEYRLNFRSHQYTQALHLAEAGVELGFGELQYHYFLGTNGFATSRSWINLGGGSYSKTTANFTDTAGHTIGTIFTEVDGVGTATTTITGVGTSTNQTAGTLSSAVRAVQVSLQSSSAFPGAISAKYKITMSGNSTIDSYNSSDPTKSTSGLYDSAKKQANGNVYTTDTVTSSETLSGNVNIYGKLATGSGGG